MVKGAAWSVPAITLLAATPAFAATLTTVPIVESVTLTGTRGSGNTKKTVSFSWTFKSNVAITGVSVTTNQPADGFAITAVSGAPTSLNGSATVTFSGSYGSSDTLVVPSFTITVSFIHASTAKTATFTVVSKSAPENVPTEFTVTPSTSNPTVTI